MMIAQCRMDADRPMTLLGGLSAAAFMRRHWQKKPLVIRAACTDPLPGIDRERLFALAAQDDVESRLIRRTGRRWSLRHGPIPRGDLPEPQTPGWTLLVQGVDLHADAAHRLLRRFRFVADARLDDVMCSWAADRGGVGPHVDSYDVFLLQVTGHRRWRVGRAGNARLRDDVPLRMLAGFAPSHEWLLGPGDMLYLPPGWGHDGVAVGDCVTASIGFRAPAAGELALDLLERLADAARDDAAAEPRAGGPRYRDPGTSPADRPARIPAALGRFADAALDRLLADRELHARALGEALSEPKPGTSFAPRGRRGRPAAIALDRRTRMLYDDRFVFVNGEAYRAGGRDAVLMRRLADERRLDAKSVAQASAAAAALLAEWLRAGWCVPDRDGPSGEEMP
jgi:50S ribosomal protein L16 3-hydroxylase